MKLSTIAMLINNEITVSEFKDTIRPEIIEYKELLKKKGGSTPIQLIEDISLIFKVSDFNFFCHLYLIDKLNNYEMLYLMDAFSLSSAIEFENEKMIESIEEFGFIEDGNLSKEFVQKYMDYMK